MYILAICPRMDSGYRSCQYDRGLWGPDNTSAQESFNRLQHQKYSGNAQTSLHPQWPLIYKELKQHEKKLRDNNMYMGPVAAFADLFDTGNYSETARYKSEQKY